MNPLYWSDRYTISFATNLNTLVSEPKPLPSSVIALYELALRELQKIELEVILPDPGNRAKNFVSCSLDQFGKCNNFSMRVVFESKPFPQKVYFRERKEGLIPLARELTPYICTEDGGNSCMVSVNFKKIDRKREYVISWFLH